MLNKVGWLGICLMLWTLSLGSGSAQAQIDKPAALPDAPSKEQRPTDFKVPLLDTPVRLADFAGMEPRAGLRDKLAKVTGFTQNRPTDGQAPTEKTDVYFGRTRTVLYVVFVCHDVKPSEIRGHLVRRENILNDDYVSLLLDPFADRRRGVLFQLNPAGVQADAAWTENNSPDYSYDQVWDSDARVTKDGWLAEFAIPFASLRFRVGVQGWGVVLQRSIPRNSETDNWPLIKSSISGTLSQEATLEGIEGVTGSHNLQINPYVLAQNEHELQTVDPLQPFFSSRKFEGTAGGEAKAIVHDSIVLDATVNPDFSDVESDQPQFTVNQRYPVFFPELRPFFLENANYFSTPIDLVYTRNIIRPEVGGRVTGKVGQTNLGFFAIDDREPGQTVAPGNTLYGKRALFAVGRVSQDLGKGSNVGVIYTDEELGDTWNRIGGADFTARISSKWTATGQMVESSTRSDDGLGDIGYAAGPATKLDISRSGHAFNLDNTYQDFSTNFVSSVGFIQTDNIRSDSFNANYDWFPQHSVVQTYQLQVQNQVAFDHQGDRVYHYTQLTGVAALARNTVFAAIAGANSDTLGPLTNSLLTTYKNYSENYGGVVFRSSPVPQVNFNVVTVIGGNINYNPVAGAIPSLLHQNLVQAMLTLQPISALTVDNTYLLDRDHAVVSGLETFENQTLRTKLNYQFTRAFSARVIVEYDSLLVNPVETSLLRTKQVQTQALFTWLPHPGTAIYVGYNNDLQNLDRGLCNRLGTGDCDPNNTTAPRSPSYLNDGRQFFVKASYLLRF